MKVNIAMKKNIILLFQFLLLTVFISGCALFNPVDNKTEKEIKEPAKNISAEKKTPPAIQPNQTAESVTVKEVPPPSVPTVTETPAVDPSKKLASEKKEVKLISPSPQPPERSRNHENYRRGPGMWRAFNRLSAEEQKELLQIQRTDPEKYRKILHEKADKLYEAEKIRRQELDELTAEIRSTENVVKKEQLKAKLHSKLKEDFQQRLQDTRRDIEAYKRRTARLEQELQKREKNCDAIINAILNNLLSNAPSPRNKK